MIILGVDPGFDRTGFGIIEASGSRLKWMHHGCIQTRAIDQFSVRLQQVRDGLSPIIKQFRPNGAVVERLFFQSNAKTAMAVGMALGVILLALADAEIPIVEMTPNQLKQGIAGWGGAGKRQVQEMVKRMLGLATIPKPDDAADALALAIVGSQMFVRRRLKG